MAALRSAPAMTSSPTGSGGMPVSTGLSRSSTSTPLRKREKALLTDLTFTGLSEATATLTGLSLLPSLSTRPHSSILELRGRPPSSRIRGILTSSMGLRPAALLRALISFPTLYVSGLTTRTPISGSATAGPYLSSKGMISKSSFRPLRNSLTLSALSS